MRWLRAHIITPSHAGARARLPERFGKRVQAEHGRGGEAGSANKDRDFCKPGDSASPREGEKGKTGPALAKLHLAIKTSLGQPECVDRISEERAYRTERSVKLDRERCDNKTIPRERMEGIAGTFCSCKSFTVARLNLRTEVRRHSPSLSRYGLPEPVVVGSFCLVSSKINSPGV